MELRSMYFLRQRVVVDVLSRVQRSKSKLATSPKNLDRKLCKQQDLTNNARANQKIFVLNLSRTSLKQDLKRVSYSVAPTGSKLARKLQRADENSNRIRASTIKTSLRPTRRWSMVDESQEGITISLLAHQDLSCSVQYSLKFAVQKNISEE
ncbi:hypothetical protein G5I_00889 [Acromyrmex echinatior]|uniref:Uncharacterized protein n=1 Tax=Acromyrmex echinatior TaxID=103372 RepID=F4W6Q6_ACREC|nr:hypothetical protein G5I_00889 [Acromyrmex echinatior]